MPRPSGAMTYRALLRLPGVARAFAAATVARLSYTTVSLAFLFTIQQATGSFATAGLALGVFGAVNVVAPFKSRLVDRYGVRRMLPPLVAGYATALLTVAVAAYGGVTSPIVYVAASLAAGLASPPVGPPMRAIWAALVPDPAARQGAYGLDAAAEETLFAVGPILVSLIITVFAAAASVVASAVFALVGTLGLAMSPAAAAARSRTPLAGPQSVTLLSRLAGPLRMPSFRALVGTILGIGFGLGPVDVSIAARAEQAGHAAASGYLLAALALGSAVGGLAWGRTTHRRSPATYLVGLTLVLAVTSAAAAVSPALPLLGVILAAMGTAIAPVFVTSYLVADAQVPETERVEANTWVNTAYNIGFAMGTAPAGVLVERTGPGTSLLAGAAVLGLTACAAVFLAPYVNRIHPPAPETAAAATGAVLPEN
jgi:MFS family permease